VPREEAKITFFSSAVIGRISVDAIEAVSKMNPQHGEVGGFLVQALTFF
jgi:hypothetical protein